MKDIRLRVGQVRTVNIRSTLRQSPRAKSRARNAPGTVGGTGPSSSKWMSVPLSFMMNVYCLLLVMVPNLPVDGACLIILLYL